MDVQASVWKGTRSGLKVLWELAKVIIPAVIAVSILERIGWLTRISETLGPFMAVFGLPGEAALVLVTANLVSFYAGLGTMVALGLTWKQLTILSAMVMICHAAISETALVARAGANAAWVLGARILAAVLVGLALNWVLPA